MSTMIKYVFDVDGTLTPSRSKIDEEFKKWFTIFCINNDVYFVTGSDYAKTEEQLGSYLLRWPIFVYNCAGSDVWAKGERVRTSDWKMPIDLLVILEGWLQSSKFPIRTGNHIEQRPGMINFSILGRGANHEQRQMYVEYDKANRERETIAYIINSTFDDITATVGGETGLDIHPTGADKSQILKDFHPKDIIHFFGDRMEQGGNDYPLAKANVRGKNYHVKDWKDTWEKLKEL